MGTYKTEREFLQHYNIHDHELPLVSVDVAIFTLLEGRLQVLLVKRGDFPHKGRWSLPGGFVNQRQDQDLSATARRKLLEKTGVDTSHLEQIATVGNDKRDPRGWSVTVLYMALIPYSPAQAIAAPVSDARWWPLEEAAEQRLAFDHSELISMARERLRNKTGYTMLPAYIIDSPFSLTQLQQAFEELLGTGVEKKSFRRRVLAADILEEVGEGLAESGRGRRAVLYRPKKGGEQHAFVRVFGGVDEV
ncbi:NUDIX domain-containing protein [Gynuella sp.]|uniref:NUDIX domain-containing protein n=1 Tax=Gynuella sp. TaxID=2969146 RepID=UPI003D0B79BD